MRAYAAELAAGPADDVDKDGLVGPESGGGDGGFAVVQVDQLGVLDALEEGAASDDRSHCVCSLFVCLGPHFKPKLVFN